MLYHNVCSILCRFYLRSRLAVEHLPEYADYFCPVQTILFQMLD